KAVIARKTIRAPFKAKIGISDIHPGQYLAEGTQLTTLQGVDPAVHVDFPIPQMIAAGLREGDAVEVFAGGTPTPVPARARAVAPGAGGGGGGGGPGGSGAWDRDDPGRGGQRRGAVAGGGGRGARPGRPAADGRGSSRQCPAQRTERGSRVRHRPRPGRQVA